jgi:spermidine/putrescine transport system permease protein
VAILTGALSGVLGLAVGWSLVRGPKALKVPLGGAVALPILLPDVLLGVSLLCFLVWVGFPLGRVSIVLGHCTFGTAYVAVLVRSRMAALDPLLEDAATDLGAGRAHTFLNVTLPQLLPALASGVLIAFTLSFDDFIISFFTAGVGATTLPLKIYSMLKFGVSPEVNALSVLILAVSLALVPLAFWLQFGKNRRHES